MTISGSYDFSLDRDGLIKEAMSTIGAIAVGENPTSDEYTAYGRMLNVMLKGWQTQGIGLWLNQEVTLFLQDDTESYSLGPSGDNASASTVKTEIATAGETGDNDIVVDSITGISDGDYAGVELDDGTVQWTTVNGSPSGSTITLTASLTDDVAVDNHVYTYTSKIQRPLEIIEARRVTSDGNETPLISVSRQEYMALSDKDSSGVVTQYYYDPQRTNSNFYTWPVASDVQDTIKMTVRKPISDFDASADDGEFPVEATDAIVSSLALRIGVKLGIEPDPLLKQWATESKYFLETFDDEKESVYFQPEMR